MICAYVAPEIGSDSPPAPQPQSISQYGSPPAIGRALEEERLVLSGDWANASAVFGSEDAPTKIVL